MARIYVADLAAYNAGELFGEWIDLAPELTLDELNEYVEKILAAGTELYGKETCSSKHEEFAIHDYEGFGPVKLDEYDPLDEVLKHVERMREEPEIYFAFIDAAGASAADEFDSYEVLGPMESVEEYSWMVFECYIDEPWDRWLARHAVPEPLARYIKFDASAYLEQAKNDGVLFGTAGSKFYAFEPK